MAKVRISFDEDSDEPLVIEREFKFVDLRKPGGREFVAFNLLSKAAVETRWGPHYLDLPDVSKFARPISQSFGMSDLATGLYEDRVNTRLMWSELSHVLLRVKVLLARSKAYRDEELTDSFSSESEAESLRWHLHLDKMENFDLATIMLGKVNELTARLVFERLGASLIPGLDFAKSDWEREITWKNIQKGLSNRAGNSYLMSIPDMEYGEIQKIFEEFLDSEHGRRGWAYRVELVHRITPSVDHPNLYTHLEDREKRPIVDENGKIKGWSKYIGSAPTKADYSFEELYADAVETFTHYFSLLERLKAIPRFSPEAEESVAAQQHNCAHL